MKKKWLGITLALLVVVVAAVAAVVTLGDTKVEAADAPVVSLNKNEFGFGEKLEISWSGVTDEWRTANIEMRIDKGHNLSDTMTDISDYNYFFIHEGSTKKRGESGTATFPDDFVRTEEKGENRKVLLPGEYTLWIFRYEKVKGDGLRKAISERIEFTVYPMGLDAEENISLTDGKLVVNYTGLTESAFKVDDTWKDLEIRIVPGHDLTHNQMIDSDKQNPYPRFDYSDLTNIFTEGSRQSPADAITETGSRTFPDECYAKRALQPGKYSIAVYEYSSDTDVPAVQVSAKIEIELVFTEISTDKKHYGYGEDIIISHTGIPKIMFNTGDADESEIRIYSEKVWINDHVGSLDAPAGTSGGVSSAGIELGDFTESSYPISAGSFSLKNDIDWGTASLAPGKYRIVVNHYLSGHRAASHYVEIEIHRPEIKLDKDTFDFGEAISLNYDYVTEEWLHYYTTTNPEGEIVDKYTFVSVDIFQEGKGPLDNAIEMGVSGHACVMEHVIWYTGTTTAPDGTPLTNLSKGSISFPDDDNDNKKYRAPLMPGDYRVVVRAGACQINTVEYTFSIKEPVYTVQPELRDSISLHFSILMDDDYDAYMKSTKLNHLMVKFNFKGNEVSCTDYTTKLDAETGLTCYTFSQSIDLLPQEMMDAISVEFLIEGEVFDWSTWKAVDSLSLKKVSGYTLRTYANNKLSDNDYADDDLIIAMLNYGAEAQKYFDYNASNLANAGLSKSITNESISGLSSAVNVEGTCAKGYAWAAATLDLQSKLSFRLKFTATNLSKVTIACNGVNYTAQTNPDQFLSAGNGAYYFYFRDIAPNMFNEAYKLTLKVDGTSSELTYSVNSYIAHIAKKGTTQAADICTALYNYGLQAASYKNQ